MTNLTVLECFQNGQHRPVHCATEKDFYALWRGRDIGALPPTDVAMIGGMIADRLAWVFTAGYQATLRNAFRSLPSGGWAAFAATEDTHDPKAHPGTTLSDSGTGYRLDGHKSWVAHSAVVDHLIITINDPEGDKRRARGLSVERERPGLTLSHREQAKFLPRMSQGFVKFVNTEVKREEVFAFEPIRQFGRTEAKFVMLASAAFLLARAEESSELQDRLFTVIAALVALISESETSAQVYGRLDREFQRCVDQFEKSNRWREISDYDSDRRLFRMYSEQIQRRAGYAKDNAKAKV